jgi:hypothetical protein
MNDFFATLYDWFVFHNIFSIELYHENSYFILGLIILLTSIIVMAIFYRLPITISRWYHWLLALVLSAVLAAGLAYSQLVEKLIQYTSNSQYPETESFILEMILYTALYTFAFSILASFIVRIGTNNENNPFPIRFTKPKKSN